LKSQTAVARGATSLYLANVANLVANTLYFLILTNLLRSTLDVGVITALNITIWLLVTVCVLAQPVTLQSPIPAPLAVLKFLPELRARKGLADAAKVFKASVGTTGIIGAVIAGTLILIPNAVGSLIGGEAVQPDLVRLTGLDILVLSVGQVAMGSLVALGDTKTASIYIVAWSIARYAAASVLLVIFSLTGVLIGWMIGDAILLTLALWSCNRQIRSREEPTTFKLADLAKYSMYTVFSALIGFAVNQADKIFTLANQGLRELAIYNVAIVAATFTGFAPYALLTVLLPAFSALYSMKKEKEMRDMIRVYGRYVSIIVLPIAMGFAAITEVALRIFGQDYVAGFVPSAIVSVATGLTAIGVVYAAVLLATGALGWYTTANVIGLGALLTVSATFGGTLGLSAPALGRAALMGVTVFTYTIAVRRQGFLYLDLKAFLVAAASSTVMGLIIFFALSFAGSFLMKLALLVPLVALGAGIYLGSLRMVRLLTSDDVQFVSEIAPERVQQIILWVGKLLAVNPREK